MKNMARAPAAAGSGEGEPVKAHALSRKFDTVHVLSGGYVMYYMIRMLLDCMT